MKWIRQTKGALGFEAVAPVVQEGVANPWAGGGVLARGALHELLFEPGGGFSPATLALMAARACVEDGENEGRMLVWCDVEGLIYPPAICGAVIRWRDVRLIRPDPAKNLWAIRECLRCAGVGAVVGCLPGRMTMLEARRLQLAAERGGGVGIMLRPWKRQAKGMAWPDIYAASTRWFVSPAPGDRGVQRWKVEFVHGQGWRLGQCFILESRRGVAAEFNVEQVPLYSSAALVDHAAAAPVARSWA